MPSPDLSLSDRHRSERNRVSLHRRGGSDERFDGLYAVHHYRTGEEHHEVRGGCGAFVVWLLIAVSLVMLLDFLLGLLTHC